MSDLDDASRRRILDAIEGAMSSDGSVPLIPRIHAILFEMLPEEHKTPHALDVLAKTTHKYRRRMRTRDARHLEENLASCEITGSPRALQDFIRRGDVSLRKGRGQTLHVDIKWIASTQLFTDAFERPPLTFKVDLKTRDLTLVPKNPDPTKEPKTMPEGFITMGRPIACLDDLSLVSQFAAFAKVTQDVSPIETAAKVREYMCFDAREQLRPFHDFIVRSTHMNIGRRKRRKTNTLLPIVDEH